jgi:hypothetical protein
VLCSIRLGEMWFSGHNIGEWETAGSLATVHGIVKNSVVEFVDCLVGGPECQLKNS